MQNTLLLTFFALGLCAGCSTISHPFLYSAENHGKQIVLLGTIHKGVSARNLPGIVEKEMASSTVAFTEIKLEQYEKLVSAGDETAEKELIRETYFRKQRSMSDDEDPVLSQRVSPAVFKKVQQKVGWEKGSIEELSPRGALLMVSGGSEVLVTRAEANSLNPWYAMDYRIMQKAVAHKLRMMSLDLDLDICGEARQADAARDLEHWAKGEPMLSPEANFDHFRKMVEAYEAGDETEMAKMTELGEVGKCLLDQRNQRWAERIDNFLMKGEKAFVAVGVAHLLPSKYPSLLELLQKRGYTVSRINP